MFCPKCGSILVPDKNKQLSCSSCRYKAAKSKDLAIKEEMKQQKALEVIDKKIETNPKIGMECPKCKNGEAYYWTVQTRAADEAETQFFECTKCHHRWRKY